MIKSVYKKWRYWIILTDSFKIKKQDVFKQEDHVNRRFEVSINLVILRFFFHKLQKNKLILSIT